MIPISAEQVVGNIARRNSLFSLLSAPRFRCFDFGNYRTGRQIEVLIKRILTYFNANYGILFVLYSISLWYDSYIFEKETVLAIEVMRQFVTKFKNKKYEYHFVNKIYKLPYSLKIKMLKSNETNKS